jgi:hypothetical protein
VPLTELVPVKATEVSAAAYAYNSKEASNNSRDASSNSRDIKAFPFPFKT